MFFSLAYIHNTYLHNIKQYDMNETLIVLCQDSPWATEGCSRGVDVEAVLQHAGGELCP